MRLHEPCLMLGHRLGIRFQGRYFPVQLFFFFWPALVKADFTTGQIAYIWIHATLNTVYSGDLSEASAWKTRGF